MLMSLLGCAEDKAQAPCSEGTARLSSGACVPVFVDSEPEPEHTKDDDTGLVLIAPALPLSTPRLLRRISLDLRGVLPSIDELDAVEADPDALEPIVDAYLEDPRLQTRLVDLLGETWHTQVDAFLLEYLEYPSLRMQPEQEFPFERSAGEEPLRLMAHIGTQDRPWTDILTADFTVANPLLSTIWPIELETEADGWGPARYTDGRPAAGVLSTNGLWLRYYSDGTNYNRGRAAAISRLLICEDILARPVSFSDFPSLADADGTEAAIKEDPYCMGCHAAIDPIAASLFGFWAKDIHNGVETGWYHAEREHLGLELLGVQAHWFGAPVSGLQALAFEISQDSRFASCATETMARGLWRRDIQLDDFGVLQQLQADFEEGDLRLLALIEAVLQSDPYRAGQPSEGGSERLARLLQPGQLHSAVGDLTGFSWWYEGFDQLANDTHGYRVMAGGVNGFHVTQAQSDPSVTHGIVVQRLAEAGAQTVVSHDLVDGLEPRLFGELTLDDRPGDEAFESALLALRWRLHARRASSEELQDLADLWVDIYALSDAQTAWSAVLSALLRDPEFVSY